MGRDTLGTQLLVQTFLITRGERGSVKELLGRTTKLEVSEETEDDAVAGGVPLAGSFVGLKMPKTQMEQAMGEDLHPHLWSATPRGMHVEVAVAGHDGPSLVGAAVLFMTQHVRMQQ